MTAGKSNWDLPKMYLLFEFWDTSMRLISENKKSKKMKSDIFELFRKQVRIESWIWLRTTKGSQVTLILFRRLVIEHI